MYCSKYTLQMIYIVICTTVCVKITYWAKESHTQGSRCRVCVSLLMLPGLLLLVLLFFLFLFLLVVLVVVIVVVRVKPAIIQQFVLCSHVCVFVLLDLLLIVFLITHVFFVLFINFVPLFFFFCIVAGRASHLNSVRFHLGRPFSTDNTPALARQRGGQLHLCGRPAVLLSSPDG